MTANWGTVDGMAEDAEKLVERISEACRIFRDSDELWERRMKGLYDMQAYAGDLVEVCDPMSRFFRMIG